jgi:hypothetical protein
LDRAEVDSPGEEQVSSDGETTGYLGRGSNTQLNSFARPRHGDGDAPASGSVDVYDHRDSAKLRFVGVTIGPAVAVKAVYSTPSFLFSPGKGKEARRRATLAARRISSTAQSVPCTSRRSPCNLACCSYRKNKQTKLRLAVHCCYF